MHALYDALSPWAWLLLRATAGLVLLPHALQKLFGFFPESEVPANLRELAVSLENWGYRPGKFWALVVAATELIAGPLLALGLFTRLAALPSSSSSRSRRRRMASATAISGPSTAPNTR